MTAFRSVFAVLALAAALAGCAVEAPPPAPTPAPPPPAPAPPPPPPVTPPPQPPQDQTVLHCDALHARQNGKDIHPVNGTLTVARRAFSLVYTGSYSDASLHASVFPALPQLLNGLGRREVWGSAWQYMAMDPDDVPMRDGVKLIEDPDEQDEFLSAMGTGYADFFRTMTLISGEPGTLLSAPKAGGGFIPEGGVQVQTVRGLGGVGVAQTRFKQLYITYFGTVERAGPGNKGNFGSQGLVKWSWGSCRLVFK